MKLYLAQTMKKTTIAAITTIAVLLVATTTVPVGFIQTADAAKASGVKTSQYGQETKNKVCGDRLCSEIPSAERQTIREKIITRDTIPQSSLNDIMDRMNKVHEKHQTQMMQMWATMTSQEQSQMIQHMSEMIEEMESMGMNEHMSMMKEMMGDKTHIEMPSDMMKNQQHVIHDGQTMKVQMTPTYNEQLNPRQIDYPNVLGFNDLHIHANRHLDPERSLGPVDHLLQTIVHHHCKVYDDMTAACLLYPYGMTDQDKPYGIEYVITTDQYNELPDEEKHYWHYHKTEFPRADATFPDLTDEELETILPVLDETYGKVFYFWSYGDTYPIGEPYILVVQDLPDH